MAVGSLEVISIPVTDQDRAKRFYADVLGFSAEMDAGFAGGSMRWVMLRPPGCEDLEQTLAELSGRGVTFAEDEVQEAPWGRWKTFTDPDGNGWVLQQNTP